ncbi:sulfite exporter TauE/SafE family protein [Halothiobacillus sp. DCM-1]|uniref:urease accessory protein UreH domain-containing protein n=1 Tax=Halothiobacillus sp. DCM-1 TaxID=3112558 RepID=UPI0032488D91
MDINLWNPGQLDFGAILLTAFLLGLVHGITPDEHTWPITFSYAIGGYSTRAGLRAGLMFSLAFTAQRALGSELAWLGLSDWMNLPQMDYALYILIGVLMALGGLLMARQQAARPQMNFGAERNEASSANALSPPQRWARWMPAIHGFVAGWGFGAFALILYGTLAPAMPSAAWGWVPGALFGLGTAVVQASAGAVFGRMAAQRQLTPDAVRAIALITAKRTLFFGGAAYAVAGLFGLIFPQWADISLATGLHVHNLAHLGIPFLLAVGVVLGVGFSSLIFETRRWRQHAQTAHISTCG